MFPAPTPQLVARKYQLVRLVRAGGMGAVYEAINVDTRGRCALKLLRPEVADNDDFKERFFREARACSVVSSDHIVKVFDSGTDDETGSPYLAMEYLEGEDVETTKARLGAMNPSACLKIVLQATLGLARAHAAGIIHRDIKPANLFLTTNDADDLVVKILDFGIAKIKVDRFLETSTSLTRSQVLLGTPLYMSPEQCKGASKIDARSDVWSLGVVLWELLSGTSPFPQPRSLGALMASIITEDLPLIQDLAPWVSAPVAEVVHRAMSRDIEQRYANAAELRDALLGVTPGGPQLRAAMLDRISLDERGTLAPRYELRDKGLLSPSRLELATTVILPTGRRGSKRLGLFALVIALAVLVAIGLGLRERSEPASSAAPSVASSSPPPRPASAPAENIVPGLTSAVPSAPAPAASGVPRGGSGLPAVRSARSTVSAVPPSPGPGASSSSAPPAPPIRTDTREFPE
ncbi:MAG TPA: serine/threonine-protein kinase [Polyangiaceae bacterium]|nr:serine/threonine-protein kinase [Polyangiaceae bacterium]